MGGARATPSCCISPLHTHLCQLLRQVGASKSQARPILPAQEGLRAIGCRGESPPCPRGQLWGGDTQPHNTWSTTEQCDRHVLAPAGWDGGGLGTMMGLGARCRWGWASAAGCHQCIQHQERVERRVCAATEPPVCACAHMVGPTHAEHWYVGLPPCSGLGVQPCPASPSRAVGCSAPHSCTWHLGVCYAQGMQGSQGSVRLR